MPRRQRDDQIALDRCRSCPPPRSGRRSARARIPPRRFRCRRRRPDRPGYLYAKRRRRSPDHRPLSDADRAPTFPDDTNPRSLRRNLPEQFQPFGAQAVFELSEAGGVAAGPRHALDRAGTDRIDGLGEHDRQGAASPAARPAWSGRCRPPARPGRARPALPHPCAGARNRRRSSARRSARCGRPTQPASCSPCASAVMRACDSGSSGVVNMSTPTRRTRSAARAPRAAMLPPRRRAA